MAAQIQELLDVRSFIKAFKGLPKHLYYLVVSFLGLAVLFLYFSPAFSSVLLFLCYLIVSKHNEHKPLFKDDEMRMDETDWENFTSLGTVRTLQKGEIIVDEGAYNENLYRVKHGNVFIRKGNLILSTLENESIFGELSFLGQFITSASVESGEDNSQIWEMERAKINELFVKDNHLMMRFYWTLGQLLVERLSARNIQKNDNRHLAIQNMATINIYLTENGPFKSVLYQESDNFETLKPKLARQNVVTEGKKFYLSGQKGGVQPIDVNQTVKEIAEKIAANNKLKIVFKTRLQSQSSSLFSTKLLSRPNLFSSKDDKDKANENSKEESVFEEREFVCKKGLSTGTLLLKAVEVVFTIKRFGSTTRIIYSLKDSTLSVQISGNSLVITGNKVTAKKTKKKVIPKPKTITLKFKDAELAKFVGETIQNQQSSAGGQKVKLQKKSSTSIPEITKTSVSASASGETSTASSTTTSAPTTPAKSEVSEGKNISFADNDADDDDEDDSDDEEPEQGSAVLFKAKAKVEYIGESEQEISFAKNEMISVVAQGIQVEERAEEFWSGFVVRDGVKSNCGIFPKDCVRALIVESKDDITRAGYQDMSQMPSQAEWKKILKKGREITFKKDAKIINDGDKLQNLYQLISGKCRVQKGDKVVGSIPEGEIFGEGSMLSGKGANADVIADDEEVIIFYLSLVDLKKIIDSNTGLGGRFFRYLCTLIDRRIRNQNTVLAKNNNETKTQ